MIEVSYIIAFIGGLLTFLAPCTLPLIPAYIGFISGYTRHGEGEKFSHLRLLQNAIMFVVGFSVVFIFFGVISGVLSKFFYEFRSILSQVGGIFIIILGFSMLGKFSFPNLPSYFNLPILKQAGIIIPGSRIGAFLLGFMFALGWSPCLGPVLGTILLLASTSGTSINGALLLATYSMGLAVPFLIIAYVYGKTFTYVVKLQKYLPVIAKVGALMIIGIGFLMLIGQFGILNSWAAQLLGGLNVKQFVEYM